MDLETSAAFGALAGLSVVADPTIKNDLSKPALALASALDTGLGQSLGLGKSLTEAGIDAVSNLVGDVANLSATMGEIVGDVIQVVPILGTLVGMVFKVMSLGLASGKTPAQRCQEWQKLYAAVPTGSVLTGSGQPYVPSDYFARIIDATGSNLAGEDAKDAARGTGYPTAVGVFIAPGDRLFRSLFGMALMVVTEGTPIDENDLSEADWATGKAPTWNAFSPPYALSLIDMHKPKLEGAHVRAREETYASDFGKLVLAPATQRPDLRRTSAALKTLYGRIIDDYYEAAARSWHRGTDDYGADGAARNDPDRTKRGLPRRWRARFKRLRRGIEAMHLKGDGGAGLWILYMDLLATAFRRGYLSRDWVEWRLEQVIPCASGLADAIAQMATNWHNSVEPHYDAGKAKLKELLSATEPPNAPWFVGGVFGLFALGAVALALAEQRTRRAVLGPAPASAPPTVLTGAPARAGAFLAPATVASALLSDHPTRSVS